MTNIQEKETHGLTVPPDLTLKSGTGPIRAQKPVYQDYLPPCNNACPAGEDIQAWLALAREGKFEEAWQSLIANNPMPAVHGRACYHPCESACNRAQVDGSISIHAIERFLGDMALKEGWKPNFNAPESGKKVLVVGAGPSGLSCAWHLRRLGHAVEIRDAGPVAGGMMHFGIPAYRLPRDIIDNEVARIESTGVKITLNHKVEDVLKEKEEGGFDAVFMAIGAHVAKKVDIPARDSGAIMDALSYLKSVEEKNPPQLGKRVAVYGGGNTAVDAARTAKRLGADPLIIYRRDMKNMPATQEEMDEAIEEGVKVNWLRSIKEIDQDKITVEKMRINEKGRPEPTGEYETLEADSLILALGQDVDMSVLTKIEGLEINDWDGVVVVNHNMMTTIDGLFAGGDMVPSDRTITIGTGHGKKAARCIDAWLRGSEYVKPASGPLNSFSDLHLWYNTDAQGSSQPVISPEMRVSDFEEVVGGLSAEQATYEASRCYSCGNCFECDGCYGACPEEAIIKLGKGKRYKYDYDKCTGCRACFDQCPCHAITMVDETAGTAEEQV